jgi:hypothetical protein
MVDRYLEFLNSSVLFDQSHISDDYSRVGEPELRNALGAYRAVQIGRLVSVDAARGELRVFPSPNPGSHTVHPRLLRQLALYVEECVIDDPVFAHTLVESDQKVAISRLVGFSHEKINRRRLGEGAMYINALRPALEDGFVVVLPAGHVHEVPNELPMTYSDKQFEDALPPDLMHFFQGRANVVSLHRAPDGGWLVGDSLELGRAVGTTFTGDVPGRMDLRFLVDAFMVMRGSLCPSASLAASRSARASIVKLVAVWRRTQTPIGVRQHVGLMTGAHLTVMEMLHIV